MQYTIHNSKLTATINSLGAELTSLKSGDGTEFIWQGDYRWWAGHAPVLFPICGALRNNQATLKDGKKVKMPRHGIARKREFKLEKQSEDSISMSLTSDDETRGQYPLDFKLIITHTLKDNSIETKFTVENNCENEALPFAIGGHPAFNCPLENGAKFEDYKLVFEVPETLSAPKLDQTGLIIAGERFNVLNNQKELQLTHRLFDEDSIILDEIKSRKITLESEKFQHKLTLHFSDYCYLLIWSALNDAPFVALEPWCGLATSSAESDIFEEKRNMQFLKPYQSKSYAYVIEVE